MTKIDSSLFNAQQHALDKEHEACPECGSALVMKHSKNGPFLGCTSYPACEHITPLVQRDNHEIKVLEESPCPECGNPLVIRNGRYGMFIGCTGYPQCDYIVHEEQDEQSEDVACPKCKKGQLAKRKNKFGKFFYSCDCYPKCKYSVNQQPVAHPCPECGWGVMLEKQRAGKAVLQCPQKSCQHKIEKPQ